ncbi:MAG: tryptophan 2,3-dioxygenase [Rickettsiaceae bacterium]|nr:tryptophan 2,3-dioxygenase [Rickettsiaceae bacterium]
MKDIQDESAEYNSLSYGSYLQISKLLSLQKFQSPTMEHDELLFIIIHQVYELWFKQIIHEFSALKKNIANNLDHKILFCLKRVRNILKVMVLQTDILETIGPLSFLSFRNYLGKSSGFQSAQFREVEFILGFKNKNFLNNNLFAKEENKRLTLRFVEPSIWEDFVSYFSSVVDDDLLLSTEQELTKTHKILIYIYQNPSIYTEIAELVIDIDEGLQEWRYRHIKMVERTIGNNRSGTGGSSGVDYLKKSLFKSFCPELWEIRSHF